MSRNEVIRNRRITKLNTTITKKKNNDLSYPVFSFTKIMSNWFDLSQYIEDRMLYTLKIVFADYSNLLKNCLLENIVMGILLYVTGECDTPNLNIDQFISYLYKPEDIRKNTTQIYFIAGELRNG